MFSKLLRKISRPHWLDIIASLKGGRGSAVRELSTELGMSYMGIKQHCDKMVKAGLLETFRKPVEVGRPEKIYRLTKETAGLFPNEAGDFASDVLQSVRDAFGAPAVERILFNLMQARGDRYRKKIKGRSLAERAASFAALREKDGHHSKVVYKKDSGLHIEEYHNPLETLFKEYPVLVRAEERMIEQALGVKISRETWKSGGQIVRTFQISTL